eukprot:jgi/Bigna1/125982/aug1.1_g690
MQPLYSLPSSLPSESVSRLSEAQNRAFKLRTFAKDIGRLKDARMLRDVADKIEEGKLPEDVLDDDDAREAFRMGAKALDLSSPVQKQYATRVRRKLSDSRQNLMIHAFKSTCVLPILLVRRDELEKANSPGWQPFETGKKLFEAGEYKAAMEKLTEAMKVQDPLTRVGGDIQIYIAFTLDAMGRTDDACDVLKIIEETHPSQKLAKQAEEFRFVMQAPVLKQPERDLNWGFEGNADRYRARDRKARRPTKAKYKTTPQVAPVVDPGPTKEYVPAWMKNPVVIIILTAGVSAAAWQSAVITAAQKSGPKFQCKLDARDM